MSVRCIVILISGALLLGCIADKKEKKVSRVPYVVVEFKMTASSSPLLVGLIEKRKLAEMKSHSGCSLVYNGISHDITFFSGSNQEYLFITGIKDGSQIIHSVLQGSLPMPQRADLVSMLTLNQYYPVKADIDLYVMLREEDFQKRLDYYRSTSEIEIKWMTCGSK